MFELWVFSAIRVCLTCGALVGLLCNRDQSAVARMKYSKVPVLILAAMMWMYPIIKLLAYSEKFQSLSEPWFWSLFSWSIFSALLFYINWHLLGKAKEPRGGSLPINREEEDRSDLLAGSTTDIEDAENDASSSLPKKPKMPTVGRLITYSRPDLGFIAVAIFFMVISSVGRCQLKFFTIIYVVLL